MEILRDRLRLAFALLGPLVLLLTFGYGISFDVENLRLRRLDQDNSLESREFLRKLLGLALFQPKAGHYFAPAEIDRRSAQRRAEARHRDPAGFGRDLVAGKSPEVAVWIDGAMPFRAETIRVLCRGHLPDLSRRAISPARPDVAAGADLRRDALPLQSGV